MPDFLEALRAYEAERERIRNLDFNQPPSIIGGDAENEERRRQMARARVMASLIPLKPEAKERALEQFFEGIPRGALHPIKGIVDVGEGDEDLATTLGELTGTLVSFLPFFKGAQAVTKGLGLTARLSPQMTQAIEGTLAFGAFEAGAGPLEEAPSRVAKGLALGASMEGLLLGAGAAWRAARGGRVALPKPSPAAPESRSAINPDALNIERWFHPANAVSEEELAARLAALGDEAAQLDHATARVAGRFRGSPVVVPGIRGIEGFESRMQDFGFQTVRRLRHEGQEEMFDVLLYDPSRLALRPKDAVVRARYMGEGTPVWSFDEAVGLVREALPTDIKRQVFSDKGRLVAGKYVPRDVRIEVGMTDEVEMYETLIHEFMHYQTRMALGDLGRGAKTELTIDEVFNLARHVKNDTSLSQSKVFKTSKVGDVYADLEKATIEVVTRQYETIGASRKEAFDKAAELVRTKKPGYYLEDDELLSRMAEMMFIDPQWALDNAPRATKMLSLLFQRNSPRMRQLLTKEMRVVDDIFNDLWIRKGKVLSIFEQRPFTLEKFHKRMFARTGFAPGLEVIHNGRPHEFLNFVGTGQTTAMVRDFATGKSRSVKVSELIRPTVPKYLKRDEEIVKAIQESLDGPLDWVGISALDAEANGLRRGLVDLEGFERVSDIKRFLRENRELWREVVDPDNFDEAAVVATIAEKLGVRGVVENDAGRLTVFLRDAEVAEFSDEVVGAAFGLRSSGNVGGLKFEPSIDDTFRTILREKGVLERDMEYWLTHMKKEYGEKLMGIVDPEVRTAAKNAEKLAMETADDASAASWRVGFEREVGDDGLVWLRNQEDGSVLLEAPGDGAVSEFVSRSGTPASAIDDAVPPISSNDIPSAGGGGGGRPPKMQEQFGVDPPTGGEGWLAKLTDVQSLFGAIFTPMENFARAAEKNGFGPAFTKIFEPAQLAILNVHKEFAREGRRFLNGLSFNDQLKSVEKLMRGLGKKQRENVTRLVEYLAKEEIAASGGLLQRGMNQTEINMAKQIEKLGLAHDVPRLMSVRKLAQNAVESQERLAATIQRYSQVELSPEIQGVIQKLASGKQYKNVDEVFKDLGLTTEEVSVIQMLNRTANLNPDKFSIYAVSRYASARPLRRGFKTGREQFAAEQGLSAKQLQAAEELDKIFRETFRSSGISPKRMLGGYWPHQRKWVQAGFSPEEIGRLDKNIPDVIEWTARRFRSGELDVYNMDPILGAFKHIRSMAMKKHFDPVLPEVKTALEAVRASDRRTYRIMSEYIDELTGKPHKSFQRLQEILAQTTKAVTGKALPKETAEQIVNFMATLTTAATIPFRPALIFRNYYEAVNKIIPRMGTKYFFKSLKYTSSPSSYKRAMKEALDANAVTVNVLPIHASTEILGPQAGQLNYRMQLLFNKGFEWYQSADDWARAMSYHAQRMRFEDNIGLWRKGKISKTEFMSRAKVNTYDAIDVQRVSNMLDAGDFEQAKQLLGRSFAREAIFRYGSANHPAGWNSVGGRLLGQFGTWPTQYKDFLLQGLSRGSTKDRVEFILMHSAINIGTVAAGTAAGVNLWSWASFPALNYMGGPYAGLLLDATKAISGSEAERALARRNLLYQIPTWENPQSIFIPGSYLAGDLADMRDANDPLGALAEGIGLRVLKPGEKTGTELLLEGF